MWHHRRVKLNTLADLKQVQTKIAEAHAREAAQAAAAATAARKAEADKNLFARAVGAVQSLPDNKQAINKPVPVPPVAKQRQKDDEAVLRDALSDEFDASTLLDTDDLLSFRRPATRPPRHFAIIGAGMAGVACARTLVQAGHQWSAPRPAAVPWRTARAGR